MKTPKIAWEQKGGVRGIVEKQRGGRKIANRNDAKAVPQRQKRS